MKTPLRILVTGAAGQIAYALLFRIAAGEMLGKDQPIELSLLEVAPAMRALEGVAMELQDGAFPLVTNYTLTDNIDEACKEVDYALLIGAKPRGPGMERSDLLAENAGIFKIQGAALNRHAKQDVRVVVVGNPANTNAYTTMKSAPDLPMHHFSALTRLDHNRAVAQLAAKTAKGIEQIKKVIIWGNHSTTQYPDLHHALVNGEPVLDGLDRVWYQQQYIPSVAKRGAEIISARGASSAASAANSVLEHVRDWRFGTVADDWTSMAVPSDGSYGIPEGLIYSFPICCLDGRYQIVQDLEITPFSRERMLATQQELEEERDAVSNIL